MRPKDEELLLKVLREALTYMPDLPYHNKVHAIEVWNIARQYAVTEDLPYEDKLVLEPASLLHDIIFVPGMADNEEKSAEYARRHMQSIGYTPSQADSAAGLILATKLPVAPKNLSEMIMQDADLDNLGRSDFLDNNARLREECGVKDVHQWHRNSLIFVRNHPYHTHSARALRGEGRLANIKLLEAMLG